MILRQKKRKFGLLARLLVWFILVSVLPVLFVNYVHQGGLQAELTSKSKRLYADLAVSLAGQMQNRTDIASTEALTAELQKTASALEALKLKNTFVFVESKGKLAVVAGTGAVKTGDPLPADFLSTYKEAKLSGPGTAIHERAGEQVLLEKAELPDQEAVLYIEVPLATATGSENGIPIQVIGFIIIGICLIYVAVSAYFASRSVVRPVRQIQAQIRSLAGGNLSVAPLAFRRTDEIGALGHDVNVMQEQLRGILIRMADASQSIRAASDDMQVSSVETSQSALEVAASVEGISVQALEQLRMTEQAVAAMKEMAAAVERVADSTGVAGEHAAEASRVAGQGWESLASMTEQIQTISDTAGGTASAIEELGHRSAAIGEAVAAIASIANQTSILSLNASIEAARAGESGKGFQVVAQEIRKLADGTKQFSETITTVIGEIVDIIGQVRIQSGRGVEEANIGKEIIGETQKMFKRILSAIEQVSGNMADISSAVQQINAGTEEVNASMHTILGASAATAEASTRAAALSGIQQAAASRAAGSSDSLKTIAEQNRELVDKFEL